MATIPQTASQATGTKTAIYDPSYSDNPDAAGFEEQNKGKALRGSGWVSSFDIPEDYRVRVTSAAGNCQVIGVLQETFNFSMDSTWAPLIPLDTGGMLGTANAVMQIVTKRSLVSEFQSRRIWQGTSPTSITMNLLFESVSDTYINVVSPVLDLLAMASPTKGDAVQLSDLVGKTLTGVLNKFGVPSKFSIPLLIPPGPSPFANTVKGIKGGDYITISIGKHIKFKNIIIQKVSPEFDSRMSFDGYPISAKVAITFQSYEIMTKEAWQQVLHG